MGDGAPGETPGVPTHTFLSSSIPCRARYSGSPLTLLCIRKICSARTADIEFPRRVPTPILSYQSAARKGEIFAYGLRNPHRLTWDAVTNTLMANDIGLHSWEEVNIVTKGANYGYAEREGNEVVIVTGGGKTASQQHRRCRSPIRTCHRGGLEKPVAPVYPVAVYSHQEGDSISSGFVYRGKLMPQMVGKYIFGDITTARLFYANLADMIHAHGVRNKQAEIHEIQIVYKSPL